MQGNKLKQYSGLLIIGIILIVIYKMFDASWFSIHEGENKRFI